jgi:hypothetical protein
VDYVLAAGPRIGATITAHHLLYNRNAIFKGGLRPHLYCLPVLKRERHRVALVRAATGGNPKFFLGTDSAPHSRGEKESGCGCAGCFTAHAALELYAEAFDAAGALERLEGFASFHGPDFYGLPRNAERVTLVRERWEAPRELGLGATTLVPLRPERSSPGGSPDVTAPVWDRDALARSPWFASVRSLLERLPADRFPDLDDLNTLARERDVRSGGGTTLAFVPPAARKAARHPKSASSDGEVATGGSCTTSSTRLPGSRSRGRKAVLNRRTTTSRPAGRRTGARHGAGRGDALRRRRDCRRVRGARACAPLGRIRVAAPVLGTPRRRRPRDALSRLRPRDPRACGCAVQRRDRESAGDRRCRRSPRRRCARRSARRGGSRTFRAAGVARLLADAPAAAGARDPG